jgi:hypothetical protein
VEGKIKTISPQRTLRAQRKIKVKGLTAEDAESAEKGAEKN